MSALVGTGILVRFHLRNDRVRILVWLAAIVLLVFVTATSTKGLYPTQEDLDQAAAASQDNPAALAMNGPAHALDTLGGQVAFQVGAFGLSMVGLMSLLLVNRLTRAEEDSGRLEVVRSMAVGRHASLAAAVLVVGALNLAVGAVVAGSLVALDLPVTGSVALGAAFAALGLVFVAVTAVTAQVTENPRVAAGTAGAVLGASFVGRAVGDTGDGTLSWFSPIGIAQKVQPYAGERWWPLLLLVTITIALAGVAAALVTRRDYGGGLVASRPGPPRGSVWLGTPLGLAVRLQRGAVLWWGVALALAGVAYGSIANSIEDFVADNEAFADIIARAGGASLTDSYLATSLLVLALIGSGFAIQATGRLRTEETALRAEPLLATQTPRLRWATSHLAVAFGGTLVVLAVGGIGTGLTYGLIIGDLGQTVRLLGAALTYAPAVWLVVGVTAVLFGLVPRWTVAGWAALAVSFVIGMFGDAFDLPSWVVSISPFEHVPGVPAAGFDIVPLAVLTVLAAALTGVGLAGFRRRDIAA